MRLENAAGVRTCPSLARAASAALLLAAATAVSVSARPCDAQTVQGTSKDARRSSLLSGFQTGLDAFVRGDAARNFRLTDFSFAPDSDDERLLVRLRPSASFAPFDRLDVHVQGQWYASYGNDDDTDSVILYQGYLEGALTGRLHPAITVGRQELAYGSTFMLGPDAFFDGLAYDAVRLDLAAGTRWAVDVFGGKYVVATSEGTRGELYGVYATVSATDRIDLDLYGLADTGSVEPDDRNSAHRRTYSLGARAVIELSELVAVEVEPIYQLGRMPVDGGSRQSISAFGGHVDLTLDAVPGHEPEAIVSYAFGSGDGNPSGGGFHEFQNPNNDTHLVGDMSIIGDMSGVGVANPTSGDVFFASGLHVVTVGGGLDLGDAFNVSLDGHHFRADKAPPGIGKELGTEVDLLLTYEVGLEVSVVVGLSRFFTGTFFRDATGSGADMTYAYLELHGTY